MTPDYITRSLFEQAYHNMLNVLEEIHFDYDETKVPDEKTYDFNWSRVKAFRYVMSLNANALKKKGDLSSYYTVPYAHRKGGSA